MMPRLTRIILLLPISITGCANTVAEHAAPAPAPSLPEPSSFTIAATASMNLTPQMMAETGLPATVKASLDASAKSEAISASPMRSRHEGHMTLVVTDGSGTHSIANAKMDVSGEASGSPNAGLGEVMRRFFDAASLMSRPAPQVLAPSK